MVFNEISPDGILALPKAKYDAEELFSPIPENAAPVGTGFYLDEDGSYTTEIDGVVETIQTTKGVHADVSPGKVLKKLLLEIIVDLWWVSKVVIMDILL